jgi:hypothetical protein
MEWIVTLSIVEAVLLTLAILLCTAPQKHGDEI